MLLTERRGRGGSGKRQRRGAALRPAARGMCGQGTLPMLPQVSVSSFVKLGQLGPPCRVERRLPKTGGSRRVMPEYPLMPNIHTDI